jgi:hypothetical protein
MKDPVLIHHFLVHPDRCLNLRSVVIEYLIIAYFPGLHAIRDVEGLSYLRLVEVLCEERGCACWVTAEIDLAFYFRSVLLERQVSVSLKD